MAAPLAYENVVYCYSCGRANPSDARVCTSCRGLLTLTESAHVFGRAYLLNNLGELVASGALDEEAAARVRGALHATAITPPGATAATPATALSADVAAVIASEPEPIDVVPAPTEPVRVEPAGPGLFSPERAPSLLLYVGAFLIVVSALIFVNVSGEQISDTAKLVLLLVGTVAFVVAGLVCHRVPRVVEAGRTFLLIGALITPLDFAAYYVLILRASPLTTPEM